MYTFFQQTSIWPCNATYSVVSTEKWSLVAEAYTTPSTDSPWEADMKGFKKALWDVKALGKHSVFSGVISQR